MHAKTILLLAALSLPATGVALFWPAAHQAPTTTLTVGPLFPGLTAALPTLHLIKIQGQSGTLTLERRGGPNDIDPKTGLPLTGWGLADKGHYPIAPEIIQPLIAGIVRLKPVELKTDRPALYSRLALEDIGPDTAKSVQVTFLDQQGKQIAALLVGKRRFDRLGGGDDGVYTRLPGKSQTYFALPSLDAPSDPLAWISRSIVDLDTETIESVTIAQGPEKPLVLARETVEGQLAPKDLPKGAKLRTANAGAELASAFRSLDLLDVAPASVLKTPARSRIHVTSFDGVVLDFAIIAQDDRLWLTVAAGTAATADEAGRKRAEEIKKRTAGWAYQIAEGRAKNLEVKLADLLAEPEDGADGTKATDPKPRPKRARQTPIDPTNPLPLPLPLPEQ